MSSGIGDPFAYWLAIAADTLPVDAKRRAEAELTCHSEEAVTDYMSISSIPRHGSGP